MAIQAGVVAFTSIVAFFAYVIVRGQQQRSFYKDLPKPPHSFLWGHLKLMGEIMAMLPSDCHFQVPVTTIARKYNLPGIFYLDLWPASCGQVIVVDPDVAMHITVHRNHSKHEAEKWYLDPLIGPGNIVTSDGARWKHLHKMLSPAFSVMHVTNMRPMVAAEVMKFRSLLQKKVECGEVFKLEDLTQHLTFDVIGTAAFGRSLNAQVEGSIALQHFDDMCRAFMVSRESFNYFRNFFANRRRVAARRKLDLVIEGLIKERFDKVKRDNVDLSGKKGLGIVDLLLRDYVNGGQEELDRQFLDDAITQVKTLVVAGTGTTSDTLCFAAMFLSVNPDVVQKLREEHERVFAKGTEATYQILQENPHKLNELEYTANVIKEVLRFYPIGNTARAGMDSITYQGREYPTKGLMLCPVQMTMHMNPEIFENPTTFDPDRYSRENFPRHAWRPFERGPRACIGQQLAMDELKISLLLITRDFDFVLADLKPNKTPRVGWTDLDLTFGDRAFQEFVFEAKPRDGMPMTLQRSSWSS